VVVLLLDSNLLDIVLVYRTLHILLDKQVVVVVEVAVQEDSNNLDMLEHKLYNIALDKVLVVVELYQVAQVHLGLQVGQLVLEVQEVHLVPEVLLLLFFQPVQLVQEEVLVEQADSRLVNI